MTRRPHFLRQGASIVGAVVAIIGLAGAAVVLAPLGWIVHTLGDAN